MTPSKASRIFNRAVVRSVWNAAQAAVDNRKPLPLQDGLYLCYVRKGSIRDAKTDKGEEYSIVEFEVQFVAKHLGEDTDKRPIFTFVDKRREGDPQHGKEFRIDQCMKQLAFFIRETEKQSIEDVLVRMKTTLEVFFDVSRLAVESDFDPAAHDMTLEQSIIFLGAWRPYCLVDFRTNGKWQNVDVREIVEDGEDAEGNTVNDLSVAFEVIEASLPYPLPRPSQDAGWQAIGVNEQPAPAEAPAEDIPFDTAEAPAPAPQPVATPAPEAPAPKVTISKPTAAVAPVPAPGPAVPFAATDDELDALLADDDGLLPDDELLAALEEPELIRIGSYSRADLIKLWLEEKKYKIENGHPADTIPKVVKTSTDADIVKAITTLSPEKYTS